MKCSQFEVDIALYAGGDLPDGRTARTAAHLAECADCRALCDELRAGQALLAELRDEPREDAMVAQVRRRVMAQVGFATRRPSRPYWKPALAAALVLAALLVWPRHPAVKVASAPRAQAPQVAAASAAAQTVVPAARRTRRHRRRAPATAQPGPPLLVQFVTDNPNIVVYWLVDQKPQGD